MFTGVIGRRQSVDVELIWASLQVCSKLYWMKRSPKCCQVRMLGLLFSEAHRDVIFNPQVFIEAGGKPLLHAAIRSLISLQRSAVTFHGSSESLVYG